jgi:predicted ATP-grasp superfamily ATP-dependent carboligase
VTPRVVVTDAEERAALGAARGLAAAGYRVTAIGRHRAAATHWSRSCAERVVLPDPRADAELFADELATLLARNDYAALVPASDASLLAISAHRDRLEGLVRLGLPSAAAVSRSVDKRLLGSVAAAVGLPPPPSRACDDETSAAAASAELGYPVMLKPPRSFVRNGSGLRQLPVSRVESARELASVLERYEPPFVVQQYVQAGFLSCTGVVAEPGLLALTVSRVLRLWPVEAGMHTYSKTIEAPPGLAGRVFALLEEIGWRGIFQLQMLDRGDGRLSVIDLNPRLFASVALDVGAGANLAAVWCEWLLRRRTAPVVAKPGIRYRWEEGELCHLLWQLRRGRMRAAASVLLPRRRVVHAWFRLRDPGPLFARALSLLLRGGGLGHARAAARAPVVQPRVPPGSGRKATASR